MADTALAGVVAPADDNKEMAIVRKIVLTAVVGGLTYLLTNLTDQTQPSAIMLSVLIGGVTLLVQFLVEFEQRQQAVERRLADLGSAHAALVDRAEHGIREQIAKINDATRLFDLLQTSNLHKDSVAKLVTLSAQIPAGVSHLVRSLAQAQVDRIIVFLDQLSRGADITYDGEDRDWLLNLTQLAGSSVDATSRGSITPDGLSFIDEGFWDSELGLRYLEHQRDAVRRGVRVRRIFIVDGTANSQHSGLLQICQQQEQAGIQVRTLDASSVSASRRMLMPDLVIFDEQVSYELTAGLRLDSNKAPYFIRTHLAIKPQLVQEQVQRFNDLWDIALDFSASRRSLS